MNILALKKECPGVQGKLNWPGLYCSLICIEPECLLSSSRYFCKCQFGGCGKLLRHSVLMCKCFCSYW